MKKLFIISSSLVILFTFSIVSHAETNVSYDSNQSVGFTGIYSPIKSKDESSDSMGSKDQNPEIQQLPQSVIPDAGDSSNVFPIFLAGLSALGAIFFTKYLRNQEDYNN